MQQGRRSLFNCIHSARPDLHIRAIDISPEIVEFAARGVYSMRKPLPQDISTEDAVRQRRSLGAIQSSDQYAWIFERITSSEIELMFDVRGEEATVKPWLSKGITWMTDDAGDPAFASALGPHDIVIANRFLCHTDSADAETCLATLINLFCREDTSSFVVWIST